MVRVKYILLCSYVLLSGILCTFVCMLLEISLMKEEERNHASTGQWYLC